MENWPKVIAIWGLELAIERLRHWDPTIQALFSNPWVTIGTWMTSFIVQLKKWGWEGLSLGPKRERERDWGVQRGRRLWRKERDRKTCLWPKAFPSPNPLFYFFFFFYFAGCQTLRNPRLKNRQLRGWEGTPSLFVRYLLNHNDSQPPPLSFTLSPLTLRNPTTTLFSHLGRTKGRRLCIHFSQARKADRWI